MLRVNNREGEFKRQSYLEVVSSLSAEVVVSSTVGADVMVRFFLPFLGVGGGFSAGCLLLERKTRLGVASGGAGILS